MDQQSQASVHKLGNAPVHGRLYNRRMDEKRPPHYLREWRKKREMTQEQLAEAVGTTKSQISELERYNLRLSDKWLRRLAPVLKVQQGWILDYSPDDLNADILDTWGQIDEDDREQAIRVLRSFIRRTGTDD